MQKKPKHQKMQRVRIEFHDEQAQEVYIAGAFNDWRPSATPLRSLGAGDWAAELSLPPGRYEYRLVVDGQWRADPGATECVPNGYGDCNCVLVVPSARGNFRR